MEEIMTQAIERAANQLIEKLRGKSLTPPLRISKGKLIPHGDGLHITVAKFGEDRPHIEIWYDDTLRANTPAFWVGFGAPDESRIKKLLEDCRSAFHPHKTFASIKVLRETRLEHVVGHPIAEFYAEDKINGFGIYGQPGIDTLDLEKATDFVEQVLRSLPEAIPNDSNISETERQARIKARLQHGRFRDGLDRVWGNKCAVLGCSNRELLRASHIKPWSGFKLERLDPNNGLLLAAHLDALFDAGLISFEDNGSMMISAEIIPADRERLNLGGNLRKEPWDSLKTNLVYHRREKFRSRRAD